MLVTIGPVASESALVWLEHAREITKLLRGDLVLPFDVPHDVIDRFESACDQWYLMADTSAVFRWSGEFEADDLALIVRYWFNVVQYMFENADGHSVPLLPLEGVPFRDALVPAVLRALAEDAGSRPFAEVAIERWPGLHATQYPYGKATGG